MIYLYKCVGYCYQEQFHYGMNKKSFTLMIFAQIYYLKKNYNEPFFMIDIVLVERLKDVDLRVLEVNGENCYDVLSILNISKFYS